MKSSSKSNIQGAETQHVRERVDNMLSTENLDKMLTASERKKKKRGRPNLQINRIEEVMNDYDGDRVVPMYEGFDSVNGGMLMLTPYEHRFVVAFAQTGNQARAAEIAATAEDKKRPRNWRKVGFDLMRRPQVRQAVGYMQKKLCVAAALDSTEVISNIREISALAMVEGKYEAALKAQQMLGEYLGILGKDKANKAKDVTNLSQVVDVFKTGEDLVDNKTDIANLASKMGITFKDNNTK